MKRRFRFSLMAAFVCLTLIAIATFAYRQLNPPTVYELATQLRDDTFTYACQVSSLPFAVTVSIDDLSVTPKWNRTAPNPPVDAASAMAAADRARTRFLKAQTITGEQKWVLSELSRFR